MEFAEAKENNRGGRSQGGRGQGRGQGRSRQGNGKNGASSTSDGREGGRGGRGGPHTATRTDVEAPPTEEVVRYRPYEQLSR